ncbi:MAG TPA: alpha/beta fold hydrolase [Xanthomonadales bacterium]|nr:alpha/beta fold hydrolase [Xanthomonadales bacterium]
MRITAAMALLLGAAFVPPAHAEGTRLGSLAFEPCTLATELMPQTVDARCARLEVPEDRAHPEGRKVSLAIAWVASDAKQPQPDPVFLLAGGPGQGARESYPSVARAFREVLRRRHVILVDQRGTGDSNALACRNAAGESAFGDDADVTPAGFARFAKECLAKLDADPRFYTTSDGVADLDAVREALGVEQVDLLGVSYGTRVALEYLRRHPDRTRAVVLDGVVPPDLVLGSEHAKNLESALDLQFARCTSDPECAKRFGSPRESLSALLTRLRAAPQPVRYRDPLTNEPREEPLTADAVAGVVRLFAYSPQVAGMLPLALHEAQTGNAEPLMAQSRMLQSIVGETIMHGMQLSVICAEDADLLQVDPADTNTLLGNSLIEMTQVQCREWPKGKRPDDFHAAVTSDRPVLLFSGEFDPVTPPRYGERVVKTLANGRHLVANGQGHNVTPLGCIPKLVGDFFDAPDAKALDAKCMAQFGYAPPFTGYWGTEP